MVRILSLKISVRNQWATETSGDLDIGDSLFLVKNIYVSDYFSLGHVFVPFEFKLIYFCNLNIKHDRNIKFRFQVKTSEIRMLLFTHNNFGFLFLNIVKNVISITTNILIYYLLH